MLDTICTPLKGKHWPIPLIVNTGKTVSHTFLVGFTKSTSQILPRKLLLRNYHKWRISDSCYWSKQQNYKLKKKKKKKKDVNMCTWNRAKIKSNSRRIYCSQRFKLLSFPIFRFSACLVGVVTETHRAH